MKPRRSLRPALDINRDPKAHYLGVHSFTVHHELEKLSNVLKNGLLSPVFADRARAMGRKNIPLLMASHEYALANHVYVYAGPSTYLKGKSHLSFHGLAHGDVGFLIDSHFVKQKGKKWMGSDSIKIIPGRIPPRAIVGVVVDRTHSKERRVRALTNLCREYELPLYLCEGLTHEERFHNEGAVRENREIKLLYDPHAERQKLREKLTRLLTRRGHRQKND